MLILRLASGLAWDEQTVDEGRPSTLKLSPVGGSMTESHCFEDSGAKARETA